MGGEWIFTFDAKYAEERPLDLVAYQNKLRQIKAQYAGSVVPTKAVQASVGRLRRPVRMQPVEKGAQQVEGEDEEEEEEEEETEMWFEENPEHNLFAQFTYKCSRHSHWGPSGHKPCWFLLWNPTPSPLNYTPSNDIHARCAGFYFKRRSAAIQRELERAFPRYFKLYWGDGISGYGDD